MPTKLDAPAPEGSKGKKGRDSLFCPYLGFEDDPSTALAYPTSYNFCFKAKPTAPVSLSHQRNLCLTEKYQDCPVYMKETPGPLPKAIRGERTSKVKPAKWVPFVGLAGVILVGVLGVILTGVVPIRGFNPPYMVITITATPTREPIIEMPTSDVSRTPEPTVTTLPTNTATMPSLTSRTPRALETPFGTSPQLVIHKVVEGEGFILLAENFNTTADAIKSINYDLPESLWVNTVLVIPINTDDVTGLPKFTVVEVRAEGLTIESYAERIQINVELLKQYNDLPAGYALKIGEWLIIPIFE
jgi:LysM repeat protein